MWMIFVILLILSLPLSVQAEYLGELSENPYAPDSTANPFGSRKPLGSLSVWSVWFIWSIWFDLICLVGLRGERNSLDKRNKPDRPDKPDQRDRPLQLFVFPNSINNPFCAGDGPCLKFPP